MHGKPEREPAEEESDGERRVKLVMNVLLGPKKKRLNRSSRAHSLFSFHGSWPASLSQRRVV